jgi:tetratricopeptide (TPR) repeat protein
MPEPFIGRRRVINELRMLLTQDDGPAITALRGMPGVGKTALATALAYDRALCAHFRGGVFWAALGPHGDASSALNRWARACKVKLGAAKDAREKALRLAPTMERAAHGAPVLLVIDDVWKWEHAKPFKEIAFPGCVQLCTTRDTTIAKKFAGAAPRVVVVHELSDEDAEQLLAARCPEAYEEDADGLRALAKMVGGLPLGLTLIAGTLVEDAEQPRWVRRTMAHLRATDVRLGLPEHDREGTLETIVEMSVKALAPEAQEAFAVVGTFAAKPAIFGRDGALAVWKTLWGTEEDKGDVWLKLMVDRGLLETAGVDRFTIHPVLRDVAQARMEKDSKAGAAHARHYLALSSGDWRSWRRIEVDMDQIRRGWKWVSTTAPDETQVLGYALACDRYFELRGLWSERRTWAERALSGARSLRQSKEEATLLNNLGRVHKDLGDQRVALKYFEQALPILRDLHDHAGEGNTLSNLGLVYSDLGDKERALGYFQQALPILRIVGARALEGRVLNNLGYVYTNLGDHRSALEYLEQALPVLRQVRDRIGEGRTLSNLGRVYSALGDKRFALEYFEQALDIRHRAGDIAGEAITLSNMAAAMESLGNIAKAITLAEKVIEIREALRHPDLNADREYRESLLTRQREHVTQPSMPEEDLVTERVSRGPSSAPSWLPMRDDARLEHSDLLKLRQAAISARIATSRTALLAGLPEEFIASLPLAAAPGEQILADLDAISAIRALLDGSVPLVVWLKNAIALCGMRPESAIFKQVLDQERNRASSPNEAIQPTHALPRKARQRTRG